MRAWRDRKQFADVEVEGATRRMAYVAEGAGDPILFLHGNPTSSFLWRDVTPALSGLGRCIAPDLIGMGDSDKLPKPGPMRYSFATHAAHLDALLETIMPAEQDGAGVTLVIHDWGSALGFDWARRHAARVRGIAYMEGVVRPLAWSEFNEQARPIFEGMRSAAGEEMVLEDNVFIERILPGSILRKLTDAEMAEYRRPFENPGEDRRPTLDWPRQIPLDGTPPEVSAVVAAYYAWLRTAEVPKLLIEAKPGAIMIGPVLDDARALPHQTAVEVAGVHFIQEDSGPEIGREIAAWLRGL